MNAPLFRRDDAARDDAARRVVLAQVDLASRRFGSCACSSIEFVVVCGVAPGRGGRVGGEWSLSDD